MAKVVLEKVTKMYGEVLAVDAIDLEIRDKEFLVLVGPSGCGKSTTLRMIAGLEEISSGNLYIGGKLVNDVVPKDRDIAMVFQNYALYPHMSVYDNMAFGLKLRRFSKDEIKRRVDEAAEMLGLIDYLERKPKALSGGQRQRVALGRAIVREPQAFLMDEPLSNLDAKLRVQMRAELSKLHDKLRTTTVYVTHDQTEAMTLGDRIAVMDGGILQQLGTPFEIYNEPVNVFVAGFIGSPQMNFIEADVTSIDGILWLMTEGFRVRVPEGYVTGINEGDYSKVTLGVRPEHIELVDDEHHLEAIVEVVEPLGPETHVYARVNNIDLLIRVDAGRSINTGDSIRLLLDESRLHLFAGENQRRIF